MRSAIKKWKARRTSKATKCMTLIQRRLEEHPHFRGRSSLFTIELVHSAIVVSGCLPSRYLRQLFDELIAGIPGPAKIDNHVHVSWPDFESPANQRKG
jgi:hypothetical protein